MSFTYTILQRASSALIHHSHFHAPQASLLEASLPATGLETRHIYLHPFTCRSDLFDHVAKKGPFSEPEAAVLMQEIGCAIALLHAQGMVHADVKPENILLTDDEHVRPSHTNAWEAPLNSVT